MVNLCHPGKDQILKTQWLHGVALRGSFDLVFHKSLVEIDPIGSYQYPFIRFLLESCGVKFEHNSMSK